MEQTSQEEHEHSRKKRRLLHHWSTRRVFLSLVFTVAVFALGVQVGRGNLHIRGLSPVAQNKGLSGQLDLSSVNNVYSILKNNFDGTINTTDLINGAKEGLVGATGDPYTQFFNPKEAQAFNDELQGSIIGIGAEIGTDDNGNIVIVSPLDGYPAQNAGLKPKDVIAAINSKSTQGMSVDAAVSKIRGDAGTKVTLTIIRSEGNPFQVTITRTKITIPSVTWSESGSIGYMKISQFTDDTSDLAQKAANEFKAKGVKGVVLDLRSNPGGYLDAAVNVSSLWLDQGKTIVSERRGSTIISTEYSNGTNTLKGLPTAVLINDGSASASEITAGALHDNGAATLVGQKSFGKGSVQQVINLADGSEMKVTIAHWYTPDGKNINKQGIQPDVGVAITDAQAKAGQDPQKDKAFQIVQSKIQ